MNITGDGDNGPLILDVVLISEVPAGSVVRGLWVLSGAGGDYTPCSVPRLYTAKEGSGSHRRIMTCAT